MKDIPLKDISATVHPYEDLDVEAADTFFDNRSIEQFRWRDINVVVKDKDGSEKTILSNSFGVATAGQVLALMGPSGSGKTTLLNVLANRSMVSHTGQVLIDGSIATPSSIKRLSSYVEQSDIHLGGLTVEENVDFTSRLASPKTAKSVRRQRNSSVLNALGLQAQRKTYVSPLLQAGISGGQKRRLSLATALVTGPKMLFLDEPTSGLDSVASHQIMSYLSVIAKRHGLIIIASIHQPSSSTFALFDSVMLISGGRTCYFGPREDIATYFSGICPIPNFTNPAEHILELVNMDFQVDTQKSDRINQIFALHEAKANDFDDDFVANDEKRESLSSDGGYPTGYFKACGILLHRNFVKSYRDPLAYGTRLLINAALSIVIGTVWLRLPYGQESIQPFVNCLFFSSAFMSLMAVAYAPSIIEDIQMLQKEHANGLYGALSFNVANFLIGLPWLFLVAVIFSSIVYWLTNLRATGEAFSMFTLWLYVDLVAAESMVVLISALTPQFVTALALVSFANGLWLAVDGFLVPIGTLNVFWKYAFHYINFQTYVFQGLMVNQFKDTKYECQTLENGEYHCMFLSDLAQQGQIRGTAVLDTYHYPYTWGKVGQWLGYAIAIILVHRVLGTFLLSWRASRK